MNLHKNSQVILFPFCLESVLMHHKLKKQGIDTLVFFDNNRKISNDAYGGVCITVPFYRRNTTCIICSDKYDAEIHQQLRSMFYEEADILDWRLVETEYGNLDVCNEVLEEDYCRLCPSEALYDNDAEGRNGIIAIKELRALYRISPHYQAEQPYHRIPYHTTPYREFPAPVLPAYRDSTNSPLFTVDNCDLKLTDICTLRCKYCSVLLDYPVERKENSYESVVATLTSFIDRVDYVRRMTLMGGEPFTYHHLERVLRYIEAHEVFSQKVGMFYLYTNATVVPEDEVLRLIKKVKVYVVVSCYHTAQTQIAEVVKKLNQFGIPYWVSVMREDWFNMNSILDDRSAEQTRHGCTATNCPVIENGRFYKCEFLLQAQKLEAIPFDERDSLAIDAITRQAMTEYKASVLPGCAYCSGLTLEQRTTEKVSAATQLSVPRAYKKYYE